MVVYDVIMCYNVYTEGGVYGLGKTISISSRVDSDLFEKFKDEYLKQLKSSFKEETPSDIVNSVLGVSNCELVSLAIVYGLKYLEDRKED